MRRARCGRDHHHLVLRQVVEDRSVRRGAHAGSNGKDPVTLNHLSYCRHRTGGLVGVVLEDELDLSPVDTPFFVYHVEVEFSASADRAPERCRPRQRRPGSDHDGVVGHAPNSRVVRLRTTESSESGKEQHSGHFTEATPTAATTHTAQAAHMTPTTPDRHHLRLQIRTWRTRPPPWTQWRRPPCIAPPPHRCRPTRRPSRRP